MLTKTFTGRSSAEKLEYVEALAQRQFGMSFGQYCASVVVDNACVAHSLAPRISEGDDRKLAALARMRSRAALFSSPEIGQMSKEQLRELVGSRYE